jgi:hypothetical protein
LLHAARTVNNTSAREYFFRLDEQAKDIGLGELSFDLFSYIFDKNTEGSDQVASTDGRTLQVSVKVNSRKAQ